VRQVTVDSVTTHEAAVGSQTTTFASLAAASEWYDQWVRAAALPLWWNVGADHQRGGFQEALSVLGEPRPANRRARVQARQVYAYATAGGMGWEGPWREAAWHGMDFFIKKFRRPDGLFRTLVALDGQALDDRAMLYDQAFALLSTASLQAADRGRGGLSEIAAAVRIGLDAMRNRSGGYVENIAYPHQANAHMHLLEGALAWAEIEGGEWEAMADEIVHLALKAFIDPEGLFLREFFDSEWRLIDGEEGRLVEPGHQFEWAWLLERWARRRSRDDVFAVARGLYTAGLRGVDPARSVAVNELWDDFTVRDATARLWPQTERLKAELLFGTECTQLAAAESLHRYLMTPQAGTWRDRMLPNGAFIEEPAPATSFYHILCACTELFQRVR
jgi:mannose/cellobiose epimerase-like protein (N-acyl-D-glucosamine 2-epimerase family)